MTALHDRLRRIREERDLSLRAFAETLHERTGYETSHSSVDKYEKGVSPPAEYLLAVSRGFSIDAAWLLEGGETGEAPDQMRDVHDIRHRLEDLVAAIPDSLASTAPQDGADEHIDAQWTDRARDWDQDLSPSPLVLRSHERSEAAGVEREEDELEFRRVEEDELSRRHDEASRLIDTARPHLRWLSRLLGSVPNVVYLTDPDGIVLHAEGPEGLINDWRLAPGYDWSESTMGTNGAGTALATERPVAVIGGEHYSRAFAGVTCVAAPIRGPEEELRGALDVSVEKEYGTPERVLPAVYVAWVIERELNNPPARDQ